MTVTRDAETMINARIAQIDHLLSIQLNEILHHAGFPEAGRKLARSEVSAGPERDQRSAQDQSAERIEEGAAARSAAGAGVRSERAVQESLRRRVRHLRRRSVRCADRRLRIRQRARGYGAAGADRADGFGRRMRRSCRRPARSSSTWRASRSWMRRAICRKVFDTTEYAKWKSFRQARIRATWGLPARTC